MKKLTLLLLIPILSFGQNTNYDYRVQYDINGSIDIGSTQELLKDSGQHYLGDGVYAYVAYLEGCSRDNGNRAMYEASNKLGLAGNKIVPSAHLFERVKRDSYKVYTGNKCYSKGIAIYQAYEYSGEKKYTKADALHHFKELKELLEIGIIDKAEYENKAAKWKRIYNRLD